MTRYSPIERLGVVAIEEIFLQFGWIPRTVFQNDVGIDMTVEICKEGNPVGKFIGIQIKSGESYFKEQRNDFVTYRSEEVHIDYWINNSLPVILILHNPISKLTIWQIINAQTVQSTGTNFRIDIPITNALTPQYLSKIEKLTDASPLLNKYLKLLPYEFEETVNAILDIHNDEGSKVTCQKKMHLKFVKDCETYIEEISTDGYVTSFETTASSIKSHKKEIGRTFVETTFERKMARGEELIFENKWLYNDAFCNSQEYFFIEQTYPCHEFIITILFPQSRPYKEFKCSEIIGHTVINSNRVEAKIINNRPCLYLSIKKDIILSQYRIDWTW